MAIYRIFPESDTFIFSEGVKGNAGKDEILEIAGYTDFSGTCLLYTSPSPRDRQKSRMPSSA